MGRYAHRLGLEPIYSLADLIPEGNSRGRFNSLPWLLMLQANVQGFWIFSNFTEPALLLLGFLLGLFYGFDGWRGSAENLPFNQTPRVRNLLWVVGGAFSSFAASLFYGDVSRPRVLLFYLIGFIVGGLGSVVGWGILILFKYSYIRFRHPEDYPPQPFSPVFDYFQYGYHFVKKDYAEGLKRLNEQNSKKRRELLPAYAEQVSLAVAAVSSYLSDPTDKKRFDITRSILKAICAVMRLYHVQVRALSFNANCMVAYQRDDAPDEMAKRLKFAWGDLSRYDYYLSLYAYAEPKGVQNFALPVEPKNDPHSWRKMLPGAPEAFLINETIIIDNIRKLSYADAIPFEIREEISVYFKKRRTFESFACVNIVYGGRQVGVLNIECSTKNIFGRGQKHKDELQSLLFPFCFLLGFLIENNQI